MELTPFTAATRRFRFLDLYYRRYPCHPRFRGEEGWLLVKVPPENFGLAVLPVKPCFSIYSRQSRSGVVANFRQLFHAGSFGRPFSV